MLRFIIKDSNFPMEVDTPTKSGGVPSKPGAKRTYTGELATSPQSPGDHHGNVHYIIGQIFRVKYAVSSFRLFTERTLWQWVYLTLVQIALSRVSITFGIHTFTYTRLLRMKVLWAMKVLSVCTDAIMQTITWKFPTILFMSYSHHRKPHPLPSAITHPFLTWHPEWGGTWTPPRSTSPTFSLKFY